MPKQPLLWIPCTYCGGAGTIQKEVKPGKWETQTCPACQGKGGIVR